MHTRQHETVGQRLLAKLAAAPRSGLVTFTAEIERGRVKYLRCAIDTATRPLEGCDADPPSSIAARLQEETRQFLEARWFGRVGVAVAIKGGHIMGCRYFSERTLRPTPGGDPWTFA